MSHLFKIVYKYPSSKCTTIGQELGIIHPVFAHLALWDKMIQSIWNLEQF